MKSAATTSSLSFPLLLLGDTKVCRVYAKSMLSWVLPEVRLCCHPQVCVVLVKENTITIEKEYVQVANNDDSAESKSLDSADSSDVFDVTSTTTESFSCGSYSIQSQQILEIISKEGPKGYDVGLLINQTTTQPLVFFAFSAKSETSVVSLSTDLFIVSALAFFHLFECL